MSGFGGAVKLTGETAYKKALKEITQNLKEVSSEMKVVTSQFDKDDKSVTALTAKQGALNKKLQEQTSKLDLLQNEYKSMGSRFAEQTQKHNALVSSYDKEKAKLEQIGKELGTSSKEYQEQKKAVDDLETEVMKSTKAQEANEKAMSGMRIEINKATADINKTNRELGTLDKDLEKTKQAEQQTTTATGRLSSALKKTDKDTNKAKTGYTGLKNVMANLATLGVAKLAQAFKNLGRTAVESWKEVDRGTDIIIGKTGATGKEADKMGQIYENISGKIVASNEDIGTAIGEVSTRFGVTGGDLDKLSTQFLKFAKLNGTDVNGSIDSVQKALSAFGLGVNDAEGFLDVLNKTGQDTGVSMDSLTSGLIQNATAFQKMGLSAEQSAHLMGQMEKSGANSETVMNGLRKALKNATEQGIPMSDALADLEDEIVNNKDETAGLQKAYELFGKSGDQIYGALKEGTISFKDIAQASDDFKGSVDKTFNETQDGPEQFQLAIQNIKTRLGDLVDSLYKKNKPEIDKAFKSIQKTVVKVFKSLGNIVLFLAKHGKVVVGILKALGVAMGAYIAYNAGLKIMQGLLVALSVAQKAVAVAQWLINVAMNANPIGLLITAIGVLIGVFVLLWKKSDGFRKFFINLWKNIKSAVKPIIDAIVGFFKKAWEIIKKAWEKAGEFFKKIWTAIKNAFKSVKDFFKTIFSGAYKAVTAIWSKVSGFFKGIWSGIKKAFSGVIDFYRTVFTKAWSVVKKAFGKAVGFFRNIWSGIKRVFGAVGGFFRGAFTKAWTAIKKVFSGVGRFFGGIWDTIKDKFSKLGTKIGNAISSAVKSGINGIIGFVEKTINKAIKLINGAIDVLNVFIPKKHEVGHLDKITLPRLAEGGVLKRGQVGLLEGDGAEAVVPLEQNTKWISRVADQLRTAMPSGMTTEMATKDVTITNNIVVNGAESPEEYANKLARQIRLQLRTV